MGSDGKGTRWKKRPKAPPCPKCDGQGWIGGPRHRIPCKKCNPSGRRPDPYPWPNP